MNSKDLYIQALNKENMELSCKIKQLEKELKEANEKSIYKNPTRYIPAPQWNNHHKWPPIGGLRNLIFNKHKNGFDKVIKKVGKLVMIDEAAFFEWMANQ